MTASRGHSHWSLSSQLIVVDVEVSEVLPVGVRLLCGTGHQGESDLGHSHSGLGGETFGHCPDERKRNYSEVNMQVISRCPCRSTQNDNNLKVLNL